MSTTNELRRPSAFLPAAGWIAWPGRSQVRLTGADRAKFVHNFCTNDIKKLQPGQCCEAFLTNIKGRILGHIFVFAGVDDLMIDTVPGQSTFIRDHLDRYLITEDVQLEDITNTVECVAMFGPNAAQVGFDAFGVEVSVLPNLSQLDRSTVRSAVQPAWIRRFDVLATPGYEIGLTKESMESLSPGFVHWRESDPPPLLIADDAFNAFRIDAGFPVYGIDLTEDHLAQEANRTAKAISFTKGCYLGQEPIARIDALGHVNRELRVVAFDAAVNVTAPVPLTLAETGQEIGALTSVGQVDGSVTVGLGVLKTAAKVGARVSGAGALGTVVEPAAP